MKIRAFAFTLMLGALLCLAPSAAALDAQPEDLAADAFVAVEPADAAETEQPVLPEEPADLLEEVPILPENPPTMISSTTPEEIGFVWEEEIILEEQLLPDELEQQDDEAVPDEDAVPSADIPADTARSTDPATVPADTAGTAPTVPTLPQTGTHSGFVSAALCSVGGLLIAAGVWLTRHTA